MHLYRVVSTQRPLGVFDPREIPVERLSGAHGILPVRPGRARCANAGEPVVQDSVADPEADCGGLGGAPDGGAQLSPSVQGEGDAAEDLEDEGDMSEVGSMSKLLADEMDVFESLEADLEHMMLAMEGGDDEAVAQADPAGFAAIGSPPAMAEANALSPGQVVDPLAAPSLPQETVAEVPPPPPAPPQAEVGGDHDLPGVRLDALGSVELAGGSIRYYRKGDFVALCRFHPKCILARTSREGRRLAQGRPLGLLAAWLGLVADTKEQHMSKNQWPNQASRLEHRAMLAAMPGGPELLAYERRRRRGEDEKPVALP